jgi:putative tryptophan/tyrosine transport system substrate-binding protein
MVNLRSSGTTWRVSLSFPWGRPKAGPSGSARPTLKAFTCMSIARRRFVSLLGSVLLVAPRAAGQPGQLPLIGFLHAATAESYAFDAAGFAQGLEQQGLVEAQNLAVDYRFANGQLDQLAMLAADLVRQPVALIVAGGAAGAFAARAATATIPIVAVSGFDLAKLGLAAKEDRPGGNLTGVSFITAGLMRKRLDFLRELVPATRTIGYLAQDACVYASDAAMLREIEERRSELRAAAEALGWQIVVAEVGADRDYEAAFTKFGEGRADALVVAPSAVFASDADDIIALALRDAIPTMFERRADVAAAGLISYGASRAEAWRQAGSYVGQILKGAKPADMPLVQSARLELVINQAIAKSLGVMISPSLLAQADEVIQ